MRESMGRKKKERADKENQSSRRGGHGKEGWGKGFMLSDGKRAAKGRRFDRSPDGSDWSSA